MTLYNDPIPTVQVIVNKVENVYNQYYNIFDNNELTTQNCHEDNNVKDDFFENIIDRFVVIMCGSVVIEIIA